MQLTKTINKKIWDSWKTKIIKQYEYDNVSNKIEINKNWNGATKKIMYIRETPRENHKKMKIKKNKTKCEYHYEFEEAMKINLRIMKIIN